MADCRVGKGCLYTGEPEEPVKVRGLMLTEGVVWDLFRKL